MGKFIWSHARWGRNQCDGDIGSTPIGPTKKSVMENNISHFNLDERQEKEFCFEVLSRARYDSEFFIKLNALIQSTPSPFQEEEGIRKLKPEYKINSHA